MRRGLARAERSLEATRDQLDVLHKANVVDAGAAGFVTLLEGVSAYLEAAEPDDGDLVRRRSERRRSGGRRGEPGAPLLVHRVRGQRRAIGAGVARGLRALGSARGRGPRSGGPFVHMHVGAPRELFRIAAGHGAVSGKKADDMQRQQESTLHAARRRIAIATDSAADIPGAGQSGSTSTSCRSGSISASAASSTR